MSENKEKSWFRKSDAIIAAFLVPVIVMLIIYAQRGIFPFGDRMYLRTDLYHQYAPFMSEFRSKLVTGGSLLHSWDVGMGVNFSAIYAYYLASPFNWIIALVPRAYIVEFISILIIVKTGLCGVTMTLYLSRHSKNSYFAPALFGIFYALSGYLAAYNWNIMWLDCIAIFPIICIGLEKLVCEKKGLLYACSLAFCILSNYYISIMICAFMVLYFIMLQILKGRQSFGSFMSSLGLFGLFSLIAGGISAFIWLPEIFALKYTASGDMSFPQTVTQYFSVVEEVARHMINVATEQGLDHWPNVYCGVAVFPVVILFIANRKISLKEKIVYSFMLVFFLVSFSLNILSFIWHGLHYPNSLPARQSFIYIWMLLYVCFRTVDELEGNTVKDIAIALITSIGFIFLCQKIITDDAFTWSVWLVSAGFVAVYCLMLYLYRTNKINVNLATFILLGLVAIEGAVNLTVTGITTTSRDQYIQGNEDVRSVVAYVRDDRDFYRFEKNRRNAKDDGAWMNFHSISLFSSTAHEALSELYTQLGCEASTNTYSINGATPLVEALFDVKYAIYTGRSENPNQTAVAEKGDTVLYQNRYCLPLGYVIPDAMKYNWSRESGYPVLVQDQLCDVLGTSQVLHQVNGFKEGGVYSFTVPEDGLYYAYSENKSTKEIKVNTPAYNKKFEYVNRGYLIELGWLHKNDIIDLEAADGSDTMIHAYQFDYDSLAQVMEVLGKTTMQVNTYDDSHVYAGIDIGEDAVNDSGTATLMTTIPFDKSWNVKVDGSPVEAKTAMGAFIALELTEGHHDLEFTFYPEGLSTGTLISICCIAALIIAVIAYAVIAAVKKRKEEKESAGTSEKKETIEEKKETVKIESAEEIKKDNPEEETKEISEKTEDIKETEETVQISEAKIDIGEAQTEDEDDDDEIEIQLGEINFEEREK